MTRHARRRRDVATALSVAAVLLALMTACATSRPNSMAEVSSRSGAVTTPSGLIYEVVRRGAGPVAEVGDHALIHETTRLADGTVVTDTWAMNFPIRFLVGGKQVIDGLDEAVTGMRVGERRTLIVPPKLSRRTVYPENGLFGPDDTLYYDVTLLRVDKSNGSPENGK